MGIAAILAWIQLGQQVWEAGEPAFRAIKAALTPHGIEMDDSLLNAVIADAAARKARAEADAAGGDA